MSDYEALKNLLLDISSLEELESCFNKKPNLFSILKVTTAEIRHSNFLAWLLNPSENHELKTIFLEELLKWFVKEYGSDDKSIRLLLADCNNFQVKREWKNIDILLVSPKDKIVITIENKILSEENGNQLEDYYKTIKEYYPDYDDYYIFLTLDGHEASKQDYHPLSYNVIVDILENIIIKQSLNVETELIIKNYIEVIRSVVEMENPEIKELCMQIYEKHKQAIDLIIANVPQEKSLFLSDLSDWIMEWSKTINFKNPKNHKWFEFWTDDMDKLLPKQDGNIAYKYYISADEFYCEVGFQLQGLGMIDTPIYELGKKIYSHVQNKDLRGEKWSYRLVKSWKINFEDIDNISYADNASRVKEELENILFKEIPNLEDELKNIVE